ncbi:MAG: ribosome silencing factor [Lachnospiraceae bacterium]|nr:ribosome silencing factor [Lachnospiraceae bacterium]
MNTLEIAKIAYDALDDKKGEDIRVLDIHEISSLADYFIISNGSNISQVQAMVDNVQEKLAETGYHAKSVEGYRSGNWILLDYGDVVIHVFNKEDRLFYDLERIWRDGVELKMDEL